MDAVDVLSVVSKKNQESVRYPDVEGKEIPEQKTEDLNFGASPFLQNQLPRITCMGGGEGKTKENKPVNPVSVKWFSVKKVVIGCLSEEVYQRIMSWTKPKAISLPRTVVPLSSSVRVSGVGIGGSGQIFISSLSAFSNHPCWRLETAECRGPQRKWYLSGQQGGVGLSTAAFYAPSLRLIRSLCHLAGR